MLNFRAMGQMQPVQPWHPACRARHESENFTAGEQWRLILSLLLCCQTPHGWARSHALLPHTAGWGSTLTASGARLGPSARSIKIFIKFLSNISLFFAKMLLGISINIGMWKSSDYDTSKDGGPSGSCLGSNIHLSKKEVFLLTSMCFGSNHIRIQFFQSYSYEEEHKNTVFLNLN